MRKAILLLLMLASCTPEYTPDQTVQATREAAEYAVKSLRSEMVWQLTGLFVFCLGAIAVFFLASVAWFYAQDRNAMTDLKKAQAKKAMLVAIGRDVVIDLSSGEFYETDIKRTPLITPVSGLEYRTEAPETDVGRFILHAVEISEDGWDSTVIPHWKKFKPKYPMSGATWMRLTDSLQSKKLINKKGGSGTTVMYGNTLRWLYHQLPYPNTDDEQDS